MQEQIPMELSEKAAEALRIIRSLKKLPTNTARAEARVLKQLSLKDMTDVAVALDQLGFRQ
jgi:hypothetical protein